MNASRCKACGGTHYEVRDVLTQIEQSARDPSAVLLWVERGRVAIACSGVQPVPSNGHRTPGAKRQKEYRDRKKGRGGGVTPPVTTPVTGGVTPASRETSPVTPRNGFPSDSLSDLGSTSQSGDLSGKADPKTGEVVSGERHSPVTAVTPAPSRNGASVAPIRRLTWTLAFALWAEHWHRTTATTAPAAAIGEETKRAIVDAALEAAGGDHARAIELTDRAWGVGWADRWWERKGQRVPLFKHFAERFSQYLAEVMSGGAASGTEEYDDNGHLVFREVEGESTADRRRRLAEHNRRVREESGG